MAEVNLSQEVCSLFLARESHIDSQIRNKADEIETVQNTFAMLNKLASVMLNKLASLVHKDADSPEIQHLMDRLKERGIELPDPANKEVFHQALMTQIETVKFSIQEMINGIHPQIVDKSGLIQMMSNVIKLDGGRKKMVDNQVSR